MKGNKNMAGSLKIISPWNLFYNEMYELFRFDKEVSINIDEENYTVKLYVDNLDKADALSRILPAEKVFGNITVKISVYPPNLNEVSKAELYAKAFSKNNAFERAVCNDVDGFGPGLTYVVFKKDVVQYYSDNLRDINGYTSTLYQNIAADIFGTENPDVAFCTSLED